MLESLILKIPSVHLTSTPIIISPWNIPKVATVDLPVLHPKFGEFRFRGQTDWLTERPFRWAVAETASKQYCIPWTSNLCTKDDPLEARLLRYWEMKDIPVTR